MPVPCSPLPSPPFPSGPSSSSSAPPPSASAPKTRESNRLPQLLPALPEEFDLTPEFRLLAAASVIAPPSGNPSPSDSIAALCNPSLDWDAFLVLVERHHVPGVVYASLCQHAAGRVPDRILQKLKKRELRACAQALTHAAELVGLNRSFAKEGLDVISLKGVALSLRLFGDPGMRHVRDIDLMVKPADLARGGELLNASGYQRITGFSFVQKMREKILWQAHHHAYWHDDLQVMVELHWRINQWKPEYVTELWSHRQKSEWMGATLQQLDDDALLLLLCSHGAGHRWSCLKWLSDVALLIMQKPSFTWSALLDMAARFDLERALAQTALLAYWVYGIRPAEPLCELIHQEKLSRDLAGHALQVALLDKNDLVASAGSVRWKYLRYTLQLRKHLPAHVVQAAADDLAALLPQVYRSRPHSSSTHAGS